MNFLTNKYVSSFLNFLKYAALICIVPPIINYAAINRETQIMGDHGLPYDIGGGQKLFLSCKGKGLPTIIMESPLGTNSDIWIPLQEKLSKLTKACIYDRAGLGLSERPYTQVAANVSSSASQEEITKINNRMRIQRGQEFTIERMVEDLRRLITTSSDQERPLMFIGAEMGALISRFYTQIYHNEVSHLILINPMVENLFQIDDFAWKKFWYDNVVPKWYSMALGSAVGLNRLFLMANFIEPQLNWDELDEQTLSRQKHLMCNPKHLFSLVDEFVNLNETFAQMKLIWTIKQFPQNVSVTIVSSKTENIFSFANLIKQDTNSISSKNLNEQWQKSLDTLSKVLHPNAIRKDLSSNSIYKDIYSRPNDLFQIVQEKVIDWRRKMANLNEHKI